MFKNGGHAGKNWCLAMKARRWRINKNCRRLNYSGAPNDNFRKNISSEDDLRSRIFGTLVINFLAYLPLLGFSNIKKMV